jgi:protein disulfide-isomerase-like protein
MLLTLLSTLLSLSTALQLTPENWDETTAGKMVFVKFFAPWCGHCKKMKPDWDKLMEKYDNHDIVVVADVDCTGAGKPLCDSRGVRGFPTVKWGTSEDLQDYKGGRDWATLDAFTDGLQPGCSLDNLDRCSEEQQQTITELQGSTEDELQTRVDNYDEQVQTTEQTFKDLVAKLQATYGKSKKEHDEKLADLQKSDIGLLKSVLSSKKKNKNKEEL